jgi:predicted class III extradiol MEMO1 family dioxygenase
MKLLNRRKIKNKIRKKLLNILLKRNQVITQHNTRRNFNVVFMHILKPSTRRDSGVSNMDTLKHNSKTLLISSSDFVDLNDKCDLECRIMYSDEQAREN